MLIQRMSANFGKLQGQTLELQEGLNIIQAPNESGKSTWCAFLVAMLYGINSRERDRNGVPAEKTKYLPWGGSPMLGRLDCVSQDRELTLLRATRRSGAPMAEFRAMYQGQGDLVEGLTGETCGETLLGVSREVYERSAFIRQSGLSLSADAELEKRIAALISTGEEGASYSEAMETLKRELNRRRHNKTGQIPALEEQLRDVQARMAKTEQLRSYQEAKCHESEALERRKADLLQELEEHQRWERLQKQLSAKDAQETARFAADRWQEMKAALEQERIPENEAIGRLRGAIVNLSTLKKNVDKARDARDDAARTLFRAEEALAQSPFAPLSPDQAKKAVEQTVSCSMLPTVLCGIAGAAIYGLSLYLVPSFQPALPGFSMRWLLYTLLVLPGLSLGLPFLVHRFRKKSARDKALRKRFGTQDSGKLQQLSQDYAALWEARESAQAAAAAASAAAEGLAASFTSNEQAILLEVRRFAPDAFDIAAADQALRRCAQRRKDVQEAEHLKTEAALRLELLHQSESGVSPQMAAPIRPLEVVEREMRDVESQLLHARSQADQAAGAIQASGDQTELLRAAQGLQQQIYALEEEYQAIALAMEQLEQANQDLQSRFSPALGRRTGQIFSALTDGAYEAAVLSRSLSLSAVPAGDSQYRSLPYLSVGAADQLYLAARLAISELVLPPDTPLVLDDALTNFDDARCKLALKWLREEARHRQVLLFTCHSREAEFFSNDQEVHIQRLTNGT